MSGAPFPYNTTNIRRVCGPAGDDGGKGRLFSGDADPIVVDLDVGDHRLQVWVTTTDETNSKTEKAEYHKAAFECLSRLIGNVHKISNIYIIDARATGYGYAGVTQEYGFQYEVRRG